MNKRGSEVAINPLITIALGVIVLIILIVIFRDQITKGGKDYTKISEQAGLDKCSFLTGRSCVAASTCPTDKPLRVTEADVNCPFNNICCQTQ
ncbi:hypothetical protein J4211_01770 [Candidatus Woesearchaeota archaeon]|nr:hypothetical protein [Candidatus Woesearchaeota archaeon]